MVIPVKKLESPENTNPGSHGWTPNPINLPEGSIFLIFTPFFKSRKAHLRDLAHGNRDFTHFAADAIPHPRFPHPRLLID